MDFEQILKYFRIILENIVIKYQTDADKYETMDNTLAYEKYKLAVNKEDTFFSHAKYDYNVLVASGVPEEYCISGSTDITSIPLEYRNTVLLKNREVTILNYETNGTWAGETNEYYRMLMGLPSVNDTVDDYFYTPHYISEQYFIDDSVPIHTLGLNSITKLIELGYIDELLKENPTKLYLKYLGDTAMDIITVRSAGNFDLLRCPKSLPDNLYNSFLSSYEACKDFIVTVYYIREYVASYRGYERFVALCIVITTLFRILSNLFKNVINRDFFDIKSIIMFFNAYSIPYVSDLQLEYQKILARNVNYLLRVKSTDTSLSEITDLLNFKTTSLIKYYIVKEHKLDANEKPVFYYKDKIDGEGNIVYVDGKPVQVYDSEKMFDVYFKQVSINEKNIQLALAESNNKVAYSEMISNDPFWIDDDELRTLIFNSEYNYEQTKYIGVNVTYKMTEMLFEITYVLKMLVDRKIDTSSFTLNFDTISENRVTLFDAIILLMGLTCKQNGFAGKIATTPTKISCVYGFNFKAIDDVLVIIKKEYKERPWLFSNSDYLTIQKLISKETVASIEDINTIFVNIKDLNDFLINKVNTAKNIEQFHIFKGLYNTLMKTTEMQELFALPDGTIAATYADYLKYVNLPLYSFLINLADAEVSSNINYIINKITIYCEDLKYMSYINTEDTRAVDTLKKFINRFKSYMADLATIGAVYLLHSKMDNIARLTHDVQREKTLQYNDSLRTRYSDNLGKEKVLRVSDHMTIRDGIAAVYYSDEY